MTDTDIDKARRQYHLRSMLFMGGYVTVNVAAIFGAFDDARSAGAWALGLVVAAPIAGHIWALLAYMRDSDEFIRNLMAKRFIVAAGIAMVAFSSWGFLELYARARHLPPAMIIPTFWLAFGLVTPFIRTSRAS